MTERDKVETHLPYHTPAIDEDSGDFDWPFWKFDYANKGVLFDELNSKFNSYATAIQDPYAFYLDVCGVADVAYSREQFETLLKARRDERFKELIDAWKDIVGILTTQSYRFTTTPGKDFEWWMRFIRISRYWSLDSVVAYFSPYCRNLNQLPPIPDEDGDIYLTDEGKEMMRKARLEEKERNKGKERETPDSSPGPSRRHAPSGLQMEETNTTRESTPESDRQTPTMVDRASSPIIIRAPADQIQPTTAAETVSKGVKRRRNQTKPTTNPSQGVRRSARLQEQAERQTKRRRL